jgi:hypothetical protein
MKEYRNIASHISRAFLILTIHIFPRLNKYQTTHYKEKGLILLAHLFSRFELSLPLPQFSIIALFLVF